jgi:CRISPR system Cascade subunit CasE
MSPTLYLSQLTLDPLQPQARRDLSSAYEMHRTLARAFVQSDADTPVRFLWRLERGNAGSRAATVLVQAAQPGHWQALHEHRGFLRIQPDKPVAVDRLVQPHRACRFRLLANPTVTRDGKRHGLKDDADREAWLHRQGARHGFTLLALQRDGSERLCVKQGSRAHVITLDVVRFEGLLQPNNVALLQQALFVGVGPGKALGLGMLSLAPLPAIPETAATRPQPECTAVS